MQPDANNQAPIVAGGGDGGGLVAANNQPAGASAANNGNGATGSGKGGKGVSRADLTSLRSTFTKEMEDMKASITASIGEALKSTAFQRGPLAGGSGDGEPMEPGCG